MIQVLIADDHALIRQGLKQIVSDQPDLRICGEAGSVPELMQKLKTALPNVVVLDISLPGESGLEGLKQIKGLYPQLPVLILSIHPSDQYAIRAIKAGASGYLNKECAPEQLVNAVHKVAAGERYITPEVGDLLASRLERNDERPPHQDLSDREFQVMLMIGSGVSLTEIARKFSLSIKTISTYRNRILKKLGIKSNAEIVKYVISARLGSPLPEVLGASERQ